MRNWVLYRNFGYPFRVRKFARRIDAVKFAHGCFMNGYDDVRIEYVEV